MISSAGAWPVRMRLGARRDHDLALTEALETDPVVMRELGGPIDRARLPEIPRRRLAEPWWLTILLDAAGPPVGVIGIWSNDLDGEPIHETGWMVLPAFQGRGVATAGLRLLLDRVRGKAAFDEIHAFPPVTNAPSNALCQKFSFSLIGARDFVYASRTLRCNHWTPRIAANRMPTPHP